MDELHNSSPTSSEDCAQTGGPKTDLAPASIDASIDWRRRMSDHIAYALLVYTGLQIFVTVGALKVKGGSLLPYLALVILVVAIIPVCRVFEGRWNRLSEAAAHDPAHATAFHRDRLCLWLLAIGLPLAMTALFKGLALFFR